MPNRIIKESICTSCEIDALTPEQEITFYRIMVNCDDYGRMEADPTLLRARLYPRRIDKTTDRQIDAWLSALTRPGPDGRGLVTIYSVNGKRYLQITKWDDHQQIRAKRSKHPAPHDGTTIAHDSTCDQLPPKPTETPGADEIALAQELQKMILRNNAKAKTPSDLTGWAAEIGRMIRIDGRTPEEIAAIIKFSQTDPFWRMNILSAKKLREKYDQLFLKSKGQPGSNEPQAWGNIRGWLQEQDATEGGQGR